MSDQQWVSLLEFAVKEGLSPSTVRRQIKAGKVAFKLESGKYFIQAATIKNTSDLSDILKYADESLKALREAHKEILKQKDDELTKAKSENAKLVQEIQELKMLIEVLEKRS